MPTGYTADVESGEMTTLAAFMRRCATAFMFEYRDNLDWKRDPLPAAPTEFRDKLIADAERQERETLDAIYTLEGQTAAQVDAEALAEFEETTKRLLGYNEERAVERQRYDAMITQVEAWAPPNELSELRKFMLEQLYEGRKFDTDPFDLPPPPAPAAEWRTKRLEHLQRKLNRVREDIAKQRANKKHEAARLAALHGELAKLELALASGPGTGGGDV